MKPLVAIVMGSDSDLPVMEEAAKTLDEFGVPYEMTISSAHRSPKRTSDFAKDVESRGLRVIIAGAGGAAHLAGVIASETTLPVIGVPIDASPLKGMDSLFSTVQMPPGVPVATVGINNARNAAILAVQILAVSNKELRDKLNAFKAKLEKSVEEKAKKLTKKIS
ncbi:MAG: 5-(carboxyamino)imidazole ribonucleotide mutase [Nitrospirota bacterium]